MRSIHAGRKAQRECLMIRKQMKVGGRRREEAPADAEVAVLLSLAGRIAATGDR